MTISSTSAIAATGGASQPSNVSIEDFLKILSAQLNAQDPLKPVDNQDFVAQIAQFASLQQTSQLNDKLESLLSLQSSTQSLGMLGKTVDASVNGNTLTGTVSALSLASGQPLLTVASAGGLHTDVTLAQIITIR